MSHAGAAAVAALDEGDGAPVRASRYTAFISYRHAPADRRWAQWLHRVLETYRVPRRLQRDYNLPPRLGRCFRDEEELSAAADLSAEVDAALADARFLIVVCSPRTPASAWVNREVERFREMGRHDRILALLIEGNPAESFPRALVEIRRDVVADGAAGARIDPVEPLAADVRPGRRGHGGGGHARRQAKLRLAATLLGVRYDELRQREHERHVRQLLAGGAVLAGLLVLVSALSAFALAQRGRAVEQAALAERRWHDAEAQRQEADRQRAEADRRKADAEAQRELADRRRREADAERSSAVAARAEAQQRLAESLLAQGDALGATGLWTRAADRYEDGRGVLAGLGRPTDAADYAAWDAGRRTPPRVLSVDRAGEYVGGFAGPNGRLHVVTRNASGCLVWDAAGCRVVRVIRPPADVAAAAVSADGRTLLTGGADRVVRVWDAVTGVERAALRGDAAVADLDVSDDGRLALVREPPGGIRELWDVTARTKLAATSKGKPIDGRWHFQHLSRDGRYVVTSDDFAAAGSGVWDVAARRITRALDETAARPRGYINARATSADGRLIAVAWRDGQFGVWEAGTGRRLLEAVADAAINGMGFRPDGRMLAISHDGDTFALWDVAAGRQRHRVPGRSEYAFGFSPDGRYFVLARETQSRLLAYAVDDADRGHVRAVRLGSEVRAVAVSPDGRLVAAAAADDGSATAVVLDAATGRPLGRRPARDVRYVRFDPSGRRLFHGSHHPEGAPRAWDLAADAAAPFGPTEGGPWADAVPSPDGRHVLLRAADDGTLSLRDAATGAEVRRLGDPGIGYSMAAFSPDGGRVVAARGRTDHAGRPTAWSGKVWDVATGQVVVRLGDPRAPGRGSHRVAYSANGTRIVAGNLGSGIDVWDAATGTQVRGFGLHGGPVNRVAFASADRVILAAQDQRLSAWDPATGALLRSIDVHGTTGAVKDVAWDEASRTAVTGGADGRLCVLRLGLPDDLRAARPAAEAAMARLAGARPPAKPDPADLLTLGRWHALNGAWDWAADVLADAMAGGADVPPLELARAAWQVDRPTDAAAAYRAALDRATDDADRFYLTLCLQAAERDARDRPATRPATRPAAAGAT